MTTMRERYREHFYSDDNDLPCAIEYSEEDKIEAMVISFAESEAKRAVAEALAPRDPSPELVAAEKVQWKVFYAELDRLRAENARLRLKQRKLTHYVRAVMRAFAVSEDSHRLRWLREAAKDFYQYTRLDSRGRAVKP